MFFSGLHHFRWEGYLYLSFFLSNMVSSVSLTAFKIFLLSLIFNSLNIWLGVSDCFVLILLRILWASWTHGLMYFISFGKFLAIISFSPISISSLSKIPIIHMLDHLISHSSSTLYSSSLPPTPTHSFICVFVWISSVDLSSRSLILFPQLYWVCWWACWNVLPS